MTRHTYVRRALDARDLRKGESPWRYGCNVEMTIDVLRGFKYVERNVRCGSTSEDGGVNQCDGCTNDPDMKPPPAPEYGDDL